ncbi:MAG TPA: sigma-54 dependent transcriptional regulator, partial [Candidatus Sulfobium mesophilum]|nr:sigma-54 dependent transcriptional regulator [Candidatus Sulfobium mesophilum]
MTEKLLIIEDEETLRESLKRVFLREQYETDVAESAETALSMIDGRIYDLIITDIILPGISGIEFLKKCREQNPEQVVIIITAYASLETAVEALRAGAYDYIVKPIIHEEIKRIVRNALRERALRAENTILKKQIEERYDFDKIIGESRVVTDLIGEVKRVADAKSNVLILGETGTGKELFARAIHFNGSRRNNPFVPINCSAIPENLLESELFGYVKGAFTGAVNSKRGLFEEADGGTVFLDEIGDLGLSLQAKLLRVIDDHEIRPLGGVQARKVDIRFITATNKEINKAVRDGSFREDLFFRINVMTLVLPPLRERKEDIIILAKHFLERYAAE